MLITTRVRWALAGAGVLLILSLPNVLSIFQFVRSLDPQPVLLVVGEFEDSNGFAKDTLTAVERVLAKQIDRRSKPLRAKQLESRRGPNDGFVQSFVDFVSRYPVAAVVCAANSEYAPTVLRATQSLRIPTMVTVATSDALIHVTDPVVIRLVPRDSKQSQQIAKWATPYERVLVLSDESVYGGSMRRKVTEALAATDVRTLTSGVADDNGYYYTLRRFESWEPDAIVFAGYWHAARDLLFAAREAETSADILLTDGCYSPDLVATCRSLKQKIFLSFPIDPFQTHASGLSGFGLIARDATEAFINATSTFRSGSNDPSSLMDRVRVLLQVAEPTTTGSQYRFVDDAGGYTTENAQGTFMIAACPAVP